MITPTGTDVTTEPLTPEGFAPYGWARGKPCPEASGAIAFKCAASTFWHEHDFNARAGGEVEVLRVTYRPGRRPAP
ncbi:hypothetical protein [Bradyrhizobium sp. HKCCYLRH1065]|uniref:hypothetical protein n=1 Tax=unclassified Bradyrhizobium TaxID=2631580 RepID=UPI003EC0C507